MKTVFNSHYKVCKVWAENRQEYGRANNIEFRGTTIYSYCWWPMSQLYPEKKICLVRNENYSVTTAKHKSFNS